MGNRAESAFDEPMKSSPSARSVRRWRWESDETSEARDSRVREEVESWRAIRECESKREKCTRGNFRVQLGKFIQYTSEVFYTCYATIISHHRGCSQSSESTLHECASQQELLPRIHQSAKRIGYNTIGKMMSKSGDRVEHGRGTLWHLILDRPGVWAQAF